MKKSIMLCMGKIVFLYNQCTNIFTSVRTKISFLKGFSTAGHRKIVSILFGELWKGDFREQSIHLLGVNMDIKWVVASVLIFAF
jgi:hypothetical protein